MNEWKNRQMNRLNKWMYGRTDGWTDRWMDRQMNRWMNGQTGKWMDELIAVFLQVICHQLGMSDYSSKAILLSADSTQNLIWLDNVQCNGSESGIQDCASEGWGMHSCSGNIQYAGVNCQYRGMYICIICELVCSILHRGTEHYPQPQRYHITILGS